MNQGKMQKDPLVMAVWFSVSLVVAQHCSLRSAHGKGCPAPAAVVQHQIWVVHGLAKSCEACLVSSKIHTAIVAENVINIVLIQLKCFASICFSDRVLRGIGQDRCQGMLGTGTWEHGKELRDSSYKLASYKS